MGLIVKQQTGNLRLGGSNTVAQYVLPPVLALFHQKFKEVNVGLVAGNTEQVESALINKDIDLGIVEGATRSPLLKYEEFLQDELVLVCRAANPPVKKEMITCEELRSLPLLLREPGSGTREVIARALKQKGITFSDLAIEMQLGGTESIKSYLLHSKCVAFLSVQSILTELKAGILKIVDVKDLTIERPFYFVLPHGQATALAELFMRFSKNFQTKNCQPLTVKKSITISY